MDDVPLSDSAVDRARADVVGEDGDAPIVLPMWWRNVSDADLLAEYRGSEAEAGDSRLNALAGEIERRGLDHQ